MPNLVAMTSLVALALDGAADQLLVRVRPVDVGGVEEGDAELERAMQRRDRFGSSRSE